MIRKIIKIDKQACDGCGLCINACHEGAIELVDGKATLIRDDYCDGLGNCLPACPQNAISFEEREAAEFDEEAVKRHLASLRHNHPHHDHHPHPQSLNEHNHHEHSCNGHSHHNGIHSHHGHHGHHHHEHHGHHEQHEHTLPCGCPGNQAELLSRPESAYKPETQAEIKSQLKQWPAQIKLVPVNASYFDKAHLLIAADCSAYAYGNFHNEFMRNKITLIGCPKLDAVDYSEKLTAILEQNDIKSVTLTRMEVPCCGGLEHALKTALKNSGKLIPWQVVTISINGRILED